MPHLLRRAAPPVLLYTLWILLSLYPNPALLARSIPNALEPRIDPDAVRHLADTLPNDPGLIERQVLGEYVPYAVPWETHGVPWYFPDTREAVARGEGDCQARMLVFASILEAKGIPYKLHASLDHIWVEYARKQQSFLERKEIALMAYDDGRRSLRLPQQWDWEESYRLEKEYFWDAMPYGRKLMLFAGLGFIFLTRRNLRTAHLPRFAVLTPAPAYSRVEVDVMRRR